MFVFLSPCLCRTLLGQHPDMDSEAPHLPPPPAKRQRFVTGRAGGPPSTRHGCGHMLANGRRAVARCTLSIHHASALSGAPSSGLTTLTHSHLPQPCARCAVPPIAAPSLQYCTALHLASLHGHLEVTEALLEAPGCDVNARNMGGTTPLHIAAFAGEPQVRNDALCCVLELLGGARQVF